MPPPKPRPRDWLDVWNAAKAQGVTRQAMSDSLNIAPGRLNDLILGRARPTRKEKLAMDGKRRATRIVWEDRAGDTHSFYTGKNKSFRQTVMDGDLDTIANEDDRYTSLNRIIEMRSGWIKTGGTKVYSQDREWREWERETFGR